MVTPVAGMSSEEFEQWILNMDRRVHDLELYVLQLVDKQKALDARVSELENPSAGD